MRNLSSEKKKVPFGHSDDSVLARIGGTQGFELRSIVFSLSQNEILHLCSPFFFVMTTVRFNCYLDFFLLSIVFSRGWNFFLLFLFG